MMERRRLLEMLVGAPCVFASRGWAQQAAVRRIGFLANLPPSRPEVAHLWQAVTQALQERGFVEGRNFVFERRYVEGRRERIPALAAELVQLDCDVIVVSTGDESIRALKKLTSTIPIVMAPASDPVRDGLVASLARPGGNITGLMTAALDLVPKQLELLKAAVPGIRRVVYLHGRQTSDAARIVELERNQDTAAKALGIDLIRIEMSAPEDFGSATSAILRERGEAFLLATNPTVTLTLRHQIIEFATRHRLPAIGPAREPVVAGLLMSYGNNLTWLFRTAAAYVAKILDGAKPADLPIEQTQFELVINFKTAKALGLTIPQSLLLRADEVIR